MEDIVINPSIEPPELIHDWETESWRAQTELVCTRTQEKGAGTPQGTDPDLPMGVQESLVEAWVGGGLLQGWGTECSSACLGPFEGGLHYLHYLHHSMPQGKQQGGNTAPPINRKLD